MSVNKPVWKIRDWIPLEKLDWHFLSNNPYAIDILIANPDKIKNWASLSFNPNAIDFLESNSDKINWHYFSANPNAIKLLKANPNKIDWYCLSLNPNAMEILETNPDKIVWTNLSFNNGIFELDYKKMKSNNQEMEEELIKEVMKPSRVFKYYSTYPDYDYLEELFDNY